MTAVFDLVTKSGKPCEQWELPGSEIEKGTGGIAEVQWSNKWLGMGYSLTPVRFKRMWDKRQKDGMIERAWESIEILGDDGKWKAAGFKFYVVQILERVQSANAPR